LEKKDCVKLCERELTKDDQERVKKLILDKYMVHWCAFASFILFDIILDGDIFYALGWKRF